MIGNVHCQGLTPFIDIDRSGNGPYIFNLDRAFRFTVGCVPRTHLYRPDEGIGPYILSFMPKQVFEHNCIIFKIRAFADNHAFNL